MAANRPAQALVRGVVVHCPEEPCHACHEPMNDDEDVNHHDQCVLMESFFDNDEEKLKCETVFKQELEQHIREDESPVGLQTCLCRATLGDIVDLKIVATDHKDYSGVQFSIVVPEKGGDHVFITETIELLKLEDWPLGINSGGNVFIAGQEWHIFLTEQDSDAMRATYDRLYMQFDHEHYHVGQYQHMTCEYCVGEEKANQARAFRDRLRQTNEQQKQEQQALLCTAFFRKLINQQQYDAYQEQFKRLYGKLPRDLEIRRWQHQQRQAQAQATAKAAPEIARSE